MRAERVTGEPSVHVLRASDRAPSPGGRVVLFVHGATFPAALASAYWFGDGTSWIDATAASGCDAWALDFARYGGSDGYPEMAQGAGDGPPLGHAPVAAGQIARAIEHVCRRSGAEKVSIVAHSWGTLAAARYACTNPAAVERLVLFGPIARRVLIDDLQDLPAFHEVTLEEQYARFAQDLPEGHPPVLEDFERWGCEYLAIDAEADERDPPAFSIPGGPTADIMASWAGYFPYDPAAVRARVLIVRGEWDSLCTDSDAAWLGTHLMHLETARHELYAAVTGFLSG